MRGPSKRNTWTPAELSLLAQVWPTHGIACAYMFPRHSESSVPSRAYMQGLRYTGTQRIKTVEAKPSRSCGSGVVAGPPYSGLLARERLAELGK